MGLRNNPRAFKGGYDADNVQNWIREMEKIFCIMEYIETQKVMLGTYGEIRERLKCIKFINSLYSEIKQTIYDEENGGRTPHYKNDLGLMKGKQSGSE
ncbi:hypothetical protein CR513_06769, partial [Mucuna pruriens]